MSKAMKAAVIGCGGMSPAHIVPLKNLEDVEIAALCDIRPERAQARAEQFGVETKTCTDYRELLSDPAIDAVHIVTPHYTHREIAIDAMNAGKWVVLEKPISSSKRDALVILNEDTQGKLGVVFQNRYNRSTVECKRILDSGELGKLLGAKAQITWRRDASYYASAPWRGRWDTEGGGVLINQAIHTIDLLYYLAGPFESIKGVVSQGLLEGDIEVEDNAHGVIKLTSGLTALVYASNNYSTDDHTVVLHCEKGTLVLQGLRLYLFQDDEVSILVKRANEPTSGKPAYGNGHAAYIPDFYACVRDNRPFWLNAKEAYPANWVALSLQESTLNGKWIPYTTDMVY